jgi:hypothetical protein
MNHIKKAETVGKFLPLIVVVLVLVFAFTACEPDRNNLGVDIFPPQDEIVVFTDTITDFEVMLVRSRPRVTSIRGISADANRQFMLGSLADTITGLSTAEIITEFSLTRQGNFGEEPLIDSLSLWLYVNDVIGDTAREMHIRVYEFLDSLSLDSVYYTDYDVTGKYNPEPLVDTVFVPMPGAVKRFDIDNPDLLNRIIEATNPTDSVFFYNSRFQQKFNGLYITAEPLDEGSSMAMLQLANTQAGLRFKYYHDSVTVAARDTVPMSTYFIGFNESFAQKINIFHHDYTGTALEHLIDNPDAEPPVAYVQGMTGVNVKISVPDLENYVGSGQIAVNAARLVFYVLPDSLSGISSEDYPAQLVMESQLPDGTPLQLYDQIINNNPFDFGRLNQSNEQSAFLDPLYFYSFNLGRHFQSVISGDIENNDLFIYVNQPVTTNKIIKFWSNYSYQKGGLRLELIYSKFD